MQGAQDRPEPRHVLLVQHRVQGAVAAADGEGLRRVLRLLRAA